MADSSARRSALAEFLRTRRERITPDDVGLPAGGRRRTPGLRREEVAQLAGVGVTWYTWLEQGRKINVSVHVLDAIARTLRMDSQERWHLFELAGVAVMPPAVEIPTPPERITMILDQLDPFPAVVISQRFDFLAYNRGYNALGGNLDRLEPFERNMIRLFFTDDHWLQLCVDRESAARHLVNSLRAAMTPHLDEPLWTGFVNGLREASAEFDELWGHHDVTATAIAAKQFRSEAGELNLEATRMTIGHDGLTRLMVYSPRDDITLGRLKLLVARPASQLSLAG